MVSKTVFRLAVWVHIERYETCPTRVRSNSLRRTLVNPDLSRLACLMHNLVPGSS